MRRDYSEFVLLVPLFPIFLLGMLPMLLFPLLGFAGFALIGALVIACGFGEYSRAMAEYNEDVIVRGYLARSDQDRHLLLLRSASRFAKGLIAAGVGIASIAIIGLY
jgi:hypothetical protein